MKLQGVTVRRRYLFALDVGLLVVSFTMAVALRFETVPSVYEPLEQQLPLLWLSVLVRPLVYYASGLYRRVWRYATVADLARTVGASLTASAVVFALNFGALRGAGLTYAPSYSVVVLDAFISLAFVTGIRVLRKLTTQMPARPAVPAAPLDDSERVLIVGANSAGELVVRQMVHDDLPTSTPVGFVDDNRVMRRMTIHGVPVLGAVSDLADIVASERIDLVIIAGAADAALIRIVARVGKRLGVRVTTAGFVASDLREYPIDDDPPARPATGAAAEGTRPADTGFDLAVIGLGYVGLPMVVAASKVGLRVLGLDINEELVVALAAGKSHIEDVSEVEIARALEAGFVVTTDPALLARADTISISVPTPLTDDLPDLSAVLAAARTVGRNLVPGQMIILESTTYPGTTEEVVLPILEEESGLRAGVDFEIAYSPERIDPGNSDWRIENTPKLVGGFGQASGERAAAFYGKFCNEVVLLAGTREAEMAKLLENTYRHVNIALVNEMAVYCNDLGVDVWEVIRGASTKPFGFQPFYPGPGVGGHCIPIDPGYLSYKVRQLGGEAKFVELAQEINDSMPRYVVDRAEALLAERGVSMDRARILLLGVGYKPDVGDTRESPATEIARVLLDRNAQVVFADPLVNSFAVDDYEVPRAADPVREAGDADLVVLHTNHSAFDFDGILDRAQVLLDTRGVLTGPNVVRL